MIIKLGLDKLYVVRTPNDDKVYRDSVLLYHLKNALNSKLRLDGKHHFVKKPLADVLPLAKNEITCLITGQISKYTNEVIVIFAEEKELYRQFNDFQVITYSVIRYCTQWAFHKIDGYMVELGLIKKNKSEKHEVLLVIKCDGEEIFRSREFQPSPLHPWNSLESAIAGLELSGVQSCA